MSDDVFKTVVSIIVALVICLSAVIIMTWFWLSAQQSNKESAVLESVGAMHRATIEAQGVAPALPTETASSTMVTETFPEGEGLRYIEVIDGCGPHFEGECLRVRSGPGVEFPVVETLRSGLVLRATEKIQGEDFAWYKVEFNEWLRYPERVSGEWYVAAPFVREVWDQGPVELAANTPTTSKRIVVDRSAQTLVAIEGEIEFMRVAISTGIELTPTPRGTFAIFRKTPSRYMQGPLPYLAVSKYYDLPGVPWNLYFTEQGAVIHGAYWHDSFGSRYSSGCVNMRVAEAEQLYHWADLGTVVVVQD